MSKAAKDAQYAFNSSVFEHASFLNNSRLYHVDGCGLLPKNPQSDLQVFTFSEKLEAFDYRISSLESGRKLALLVIEDSLRKLNRDPSLGLYVLNFPFHEEDLAISIHFYKSAENREIVPQPYVAIISIEDGVIRYYSWDEQMGYRVMREEKISDAYNV